jgi:hypothetical protein
MRSLTLIALWALGAPVLAQQTESPAHSAESPAPSEAIDEVIVPGSKPENLRVEIERLEADVYERFNALNSDDDFDIHCFKQAPTGSNIPVRNCAPNFVTRAESGAAKKLLADGRGGAGNNNNPAEHAMRMQQKSQELTAEMQRVARQDERLMRALVRLDELRQLQSREQPPPAKH